MVLSNKEFPLSSFEFIVSLSASLIIVIAFKVFSVSVLVGFLPLASSASSITSHIVSKVGCCLYSYIFLRDIIITNSSTYLKKQISQLNKIDE